MEKKKLGFVGGLKEFCRKRIVALKHKPQTIPMIMLVITFLYYSLNLTQISNATAIVNMTPMGLCGFIAMLFSMLALVCFMNSFPSRKPVNKPMLILMFVMMVGILVADTVYYNTVMNALMGGAGSAVKLTADKQMVMLKAITVLWNHRILIVISLALVVLMPLYSKLIRKINTSIEVEAGEEMATIDVAGED